MSTTGQDDTFYECLWGTVDIMWKVITVLIGQLWIVEAFILVERVDW